MRRVLIAGQGVYYIATGLWPLMSLSTFEAVSGPKTDDWLVHMVGVLAAAVGIALLVGVRRAEPSAETLILAFAAAAAFTVIDVTYALKGTISRIYLADAAVQAVVMTALLLGSARKRGT